MKTVVVVALFAIIVALFTALFYLYRDRGHGTRMVKALAIRVALSMGLVAFLVFSYKLIHGTASDGKLEGDNLYPAPTLKVDPGERLIVHLGNALTSLTIKEFVNPDAYRPVRTWFGNLSAVAALRPLDAFNTSSMVAMSRPSDTPNAIASLVAASAVADRKLLASFIACAMPGRVPTR